MHAKKFYVTQNAVDDLGNTLQERFWDQNESNLAENLILTISIMHADEFV